MSDSKINQKNIRNQDFIQESNFVNYVAEYDSNKVSSTDLLIQFLSSIMTKDYETALKYCLEILKREPKNLTALEFYPLILEKLEMIKDEELETTSSDSSVSSSSTTSSSSSSDGSIFRHQFLNKRSPYQWSRTHSGYKDTLLETINSNLTSNPKTSEKETGKETKKSVESNICLHSTPKKKFLTFPKDEDNPSNNITRHETPLPSNLLIHPTQTITLIGNNASNMGTRTIPRSNQEKQTPDNLQKQHSKILLRTTRTITFPKKLQHRDWTRTENPQ